MIESLTDTRKDLIILTADKNMEFAVKGVLSRQRSLNIREVTADFRVHPENDPGCLLRSHEFIKPFINQYEHALVLLDREGSGQDHKSREVLESEIENKLSENGWNNRAAAIVIDPELEIWIWSISPHLENVLGWHGKSPNLRNWLQDRQFLTGNQIKPTQPKEALEQALRTAKKARSSSIYQQVAQKVSLERCTDSSFIKFKSLLQLWFSATTSL